MGMPKVLAEFIAVTIFFAGMVIAFGFEDFVNYIKRKIGR